MGAPYLIEIRLFGRARYEIKRIIEFICNKYNIPKPEHIVPHITLIGGFSTNDEKQLIRDFNSVCCCTGLVGYIIEGKGSFPKPGVIYLDVQSSEKLIIF
jgi:hypothetical protein